MIYSEESSLPAPSLREPYFISRTYTTGRLCIDGTIRLTKALVLAVIMFVPLAPSSLSDRPAEVCERQIWVGEYQYASASVHESD
jgi:hypothetical protein